MIAPTSFTPPAHRPSPPPHLPRRGFLRRALLAPAGLSALRSLSAAADSAGYQLGCYTRPWDAYPYEVALDGIAEAGFRYAGLMTAKGKNWVIVTVDSTPEEVARIADAAKARNLEILSIYGGDFPVAISVQAGIAGLRRLIDHSVSCRCPNLMLGGTGDAALFDAYYKVVAECCDYAREKNVGLSIKPHGGTNATGPQCRRIIEQVGHPNFRLWYDPGNIFYYSDGALDPVDDATTVNGLVAGMSVKDFLPPKEVLVTPGTGKVDFPKVLAALRQGGFTHGPMLVECLARGDATTVTLQARKTLRYLQALTGSALPH
ncbi:MAG: sugar phosphate isomerase/epimerase [Verrucomicrobia bacterium]|nr:sugar phosphate isomerase/epimerase [Verrucomicrobiota bacterium]